MKKLSTLILGLLLASSLWASDENEDQKQILAAGARLFSQKEKIDIQEQRTLENKDNPQEETVTNGAYYFTSHIESNHYPIRIWESNVKVELHDGSIWSIAYGDRWKLNDWLLTDVIAIFPNRYFFSSYDYILSNQRTGDVVCVDLDGMEILPYDPTFMGLRRFIINIDYVGNFLYLNDGSIWSISTNDDYIFRRMYVGEVVFIGLNNNWDSNTRPNILIHFDTQQYCRGVCIN